MLPLAAVAAPTAPPAEPDQAHSGGTIVGTIVAIDYQGDTLGVAAGARRRIEISVMPSTSIQGKDTAYHTFTDLKTGESVRILSSIAGGKYVAQIIWIR
jgi:hypothetical protein